MRPLLAALLVAAALAGCGKSYSQICDDQCIRIQQCIGGNQQSVMNCEAGCTGQDYDKDNCTPQSQSNRWACINQCNNYADCQQWGSCVFNCPGCVKQ